MLFEIHSEGRIAYKRLSDADLKRGNSHQTHIGLSMDSLTFMPDDKTEYSGMLIYKDYCDILSCEIAKIHRANGTYNAPKISMGNNRGENIVSKVRKFAQEAENKNYYLLWFGLDSLTPLFLLIKEGSEDYISLNQFCNFDLLKSTSIKIIDQSSFFFDSVINYIKNKIAAVTVSLEKDLELSVELEEDNDKFKYADVKKAKSYIQQIGKQGEELINEYLEHLKFEKQLGSFDWMNKSAEQGKPFDFYLKYANGKEQWIDVKTTEHNFEQSFIVSKNEINFITEKKNRDYAVFRVYSKQDMQAKLKICTDCLAYMCKLSRDLEYMTRSMGDYKARMINYKIAVEPGAISFNDISNEILIGQGY